MVMPPSVLQEIFWWNWEWLQPCEGGLNQKISLSYVRKKGGLVQV